MEPNDHTTTANDTREETQQQDAGLTAAEASLAPPRQGDRDPLWLPRGSVRAIIALGVIGVWAALEVGAVGGDPSDAVRSMAVAVAAGYGFLRFRANHQPQDRSGR